MICYVIFGYVLSHFTVAYSVSIVVGITFTEKWNTDNMLATEVTVEDQLLKGLKMSFDTQFVPQTGSVLCVVIHCKHVHSSRGCKKTCLDILKTVVDFVHLSQWQQNRQKWDEIHTFCGLQNAQS